METSINLHILCHKILLKYSADLDENIVNGKCSDAQMHTLSEDTG